MNYSEYLSHVRANFSKEQDVAVDRYNAKMFYAEKFEMKWLATKLKIFSFIHYVPCVTIQDISHYSASCLSYALNVYKGLPRGFQNGVASFNLLASEKADPEALQFARSRPKKHFAAMEMPVIFDLSSNKLFYYDKTPLWGAIYYKYFREYIESNFNAQ